MKTTQRITIDEILRLFFSQQSAGKKGLTLTRIRTVEQRLRECVEAEADRILVTADRQLVAAERQFDPNAAVARTMHADDLVYLLSIFVEQAWLPDDRVQRAKQVQLAAALADHLLRTGLVNPEGMSCPLIEIRGAVYRERALQRRARLENRMQSRRAG